MIVNIFYYIHWLMLCPIVIRQAPCGEDVNRWQRPTVGHYSEKVRDRQTDTERGLHWVPLFGA